MQPHQQHTGRIAAEIKRGVRGTEQIHQFIVDDLDNLLAGMNALNDLLAERLGFDAFNEIAGDLEIDIGLQQGEAHLAQRIADVGLGNFAEAAQVLEGVLELVAQRIEHKVTLRQRR